LSTNIDRFFVITGGPGSGKSTLIEALHQRGYACSIEAGRAIIHDQVAIDGPALPWKDSALFAELILCWEMRNYHLAEETAGLVFFDRGMPDVVGYLRLMNLSIPAHMQSAVTNLRYNHRIFIAPP
jgi:predicted ATPase